MRKACLIGTATYHHRLQSTKRYTDVQLDALDLHCRNELFHTALKEVAQSDTHDQEDVRDRYARVS